MPGEDQTATLTYGTDLSSGTEDVWLYFPDNEAYGQFTGAKNAETTDGGLGRYGHFAVSDSNGGLDVPVVQLAERAFRLHRDVCPVNGNGRGGSAQKPTGETDTPPYCGVPHYILLASNVANGTGGTITITFGLTGKQTQQNQAEFLPAADSSTRSWAPSTGSGQTRRTSKDSPVRTNLPVVSRYNGSPPAQDTR